MANRRSIGLGPALLLLAGGCGNPPLPVEGTVTVNGKPAIGGAVAFDVGDGSRPETIAPITRGRYAALVPAASGKPVAVRVQAAWKTGRRVPVGPPAPPNEMTDEVALTPEKYNHPGAFSATFERGKVNRFDFDLKPK